MADIGKAPEGFPRRMQAARALAGLDIKDLARKIDARGLGERSLRSIEAGEVENVHPSRQTAILEACDLPAEFATFNFWLLEPVSDGLEGVQDNGTADDVLIRRAFDALNDRQQIERRLADLEQVMVEVVKRLPVSTGQRRLTFPPSRKRVQAAPPGSRRRAS